jgi:hypothetical protein
MVKYSARLFMPHLELGLWVVGLELDARLQRAYGVRRVLGRLRPGSSERAGAEHRRQGDLGEQGGSVEEHRQDVFEKV